MKQYLVWLSSIMAMPSLHAMMGQSEIDPKPLACAFFEAIVETDTLQRRVNLLHANLPDPEWVNGELVQAGSYGDVRIAVRNAATFHFMSECFRELERLFPGNAHLDSNHPSFNQLIESNRRHHVVLRAMIDTMLPHVQQNVIDEIWARRTPTQLEFIELIELPSEE